MILRLCGFGALFFSPSSAGGLTCSKDTHFPCHIFGCPGMLGDVECKGGWCQCTAETCWEWGKCHVKEADQVIAEKKEKVRADTCNKAWQYGCARSYKPFTDCCDCAQESKSALRCDWGYQLPCCPDLHDGHYDYDPLSEAACFRACKKLGDNHNNALDYCPGGPLEIDPDIAACDPAKKSLMTTADAAYCKSDFKNTCEWSFGATISFTKHAVSGSFQFGDEIACVEACDALGSNDNKPEDYCNPPVELRRKIDACPAAAQSFQSQLDQKTTDLWCKPKTLGLVGVKPLGQSKVVPRTEAEQFSPLPQATELETAVQYEARRTQICYEAYMDDCFDFGNFKECCHTCHKASATHQCSWSVTFGEGANEQHFGFTVEAVDGDPRGWQECDDFCDKMKETNPGDFCPDPTTGLLKIDEITKKCDLAAFEWKKPQNHIPKAWCKSMIGQAVALSDDGISDVIVQPHFFVVCVMVIVAVAIVIRFKSRGRVEAYQPLLE